jgi:hypothetical protein
MSYSSIYNTVKRINWKNRETKMISNYVAEQTINTLTTTAAVYAFPAPGIGTAANQRLGNKMDGVGIKANILFNSNASLPILVRMLILGIPQGVQFTDADVVANLFDLSVPASSPETSAAPTGSITDINRVINRNELKVIRDQVVPLNSNTVDYSFAQRELYVRTPGRIVFDDSDQSQPTTMRYVMVFIPRQANADESTGSNVEISYVLTNYFKDL